MVLVALCLTIVLGIAVAGYVTLCAHTMVLSNRSFCYTSSTQLAETGLEQALWTLNQARNTPGYAWPGWTIANGSATMAPLTGFATNRGVPGAVNVTVENYSSSSPTITAHGILQMPDGITIDKELKIQAQPATAFFSGAIGAYNSIGFSSYHTNSLDSYDSSLGDGATQTLTDQAIVSAPNVSVNDANILGYVATNGSAPFFAALGTVKGLNTPAGTNRDLGRIIANTSQNLFDILPNDNLPGDNGGTLGSGSSDLKSEIADKPPLIRYMVCGDLTLGSGDTLTIEEPVIIVVPGNLSIQDGGSIVIKGNGSAQIIVDGWIDIQGGGIDNQTKLPKNLAIFRRGTSGSSSNYPYFEGSSYTARLDSPVAFYGVIYDPAGSLLVHGSTVYGSLVANVVAVRGESSVHYDLDLRRATTTFSALNTPYVAQWLEN